MQKNEDMHNSLAKRNYTEIKNHTLKIICNHGNGIAI